MLATLLATLGHFHEQATQQLRIELACLKPYPRERCARTTGFEKMLDTLFVFSIRVLKTFGCYITPVPGLASFAEFIDQPPRAGGKRSEHKEASHVLLWQVRS